MMLLSSAIQWCYSVVLSNDVTQWCYSKTLLSGAIQLCYSVVLSDGVTQWCYPMVLISGAIQWCYSVVLSNGVTQWCYPMVLLSGAIQWCHSVMLSNAVTQWCYPMLLLSLLLLRRVLDIHCQIDSSQCFGTVDTGKGWKSQVCPRAIGGITTCHKMRHSLSLPTVTYICMGELPHFHHSPTTSFLHSQPIQAPPSGPGLVCAAGQMFIWDDPSVTQWCYPMVLLRGATQWPFARLVRLFLLPTSSPLHKEQLPFSPSQHNTTTCLQSFTT